jgi:hypothetical protein
MGARRPNAGLPRSLNGLAASLVVSKAFPSLSRLAPRVLSDISVRPEAEGDFGVGGGVDPFFIGAGPFAVAQSGFTATRTCTRQHDRVKAK